jgi:uncharacterized membrane protein
MTLFVAIKFVHVLLAIVAVGFNATYGIWLARAAREPDKGLFVLRGIKLLDDRFANPAYVLLLVSGIAMVLINQLPFSTFWIAAAIALYVVLLVVGLGVYTPTLRRQIATFESEGPDSETYRSLATRGTAVGIVLAVVAIAIVFLMVTKPTL